MKEYLKNTATDHIELKDDYFPAEKVTPYNSLSTQSKSPIRQNGHQLNVQGGDFVPSSSSQEQGTKGHNDNAAPTPEVKKQKLSPLTRQA
jgi:hypothetical protein